MNYKTIINPNINDNFITVNFSKRQKSVKVLRQGLVFVAIKVGKSNVLIKIDLLKKSLRLTAKISQIN